MGERTLSSAPMHILDSQPWTKTASSVQCRRSARQAGHIPTNLRRDLMRKVTLTLAIALLFAGSAVLTADAQTSRGANNIAFFFQAEDGIRDRDVTGVQTCALPI